MIRGLRELAALLESWPDLPAPYTVDVLVFPPDGTDAEICAEVDRIAALLGVAVQDATAQRAHYTASKSFRAGQLPGRRHPVPYPRLSRRAELLRRQRHARH